MWEFEPRGENAFFSLFSSLFFSFAVEAGNLGHGTTGWQNLLWANQEIWDIEPQGEDSPCARIRKCGRSSLEVKMHVVVESRNLGHPISKMHFVLEPRIRGLLEMKTHFAVAWEIRSIGGTYDLYVSFFATTDTKRHNIVQLVSKRFEILTKHRHFKIVKLF